MGGGVSSPIITLKLQYSGCWKGVRWRGDPNTGARAPTNDNWPRNGGIKNLYSVLLVNFDDCFLFLLITALLKGSGPYFLKGENWFKVTEIQQAGTSGFKPVPDGNLITVLFRFHINSKHSHFRNWDDVQPKWATLAETRICRSLEWPSRKIDRRTSSQLFDNSIISIKKKN